MPITDVLGDDDFFFPFLSMSHGIQKHQQLRHHMWTPALRCSMLSWSCLLSSGLLQQRPEGCCKLLSPQMGASVETTVFKTWFSQNIQDQEEEQISREKCKCIRPHLVLGLATKRKKKKVWLLSNQENFELLSISLLFCHVLPLFYFWSKMTVLLCHCYKLVLSHFTCLRNRI